MKRTFRNILVLSVLMAASWAAAGYVASWRFGPLAYQASAVAAGINWLAGCLALTAMGWASGKAWRVQAALLAMAVRMTLPLVALAVFSRSAAPLSSHGVAGLIVVHYLVGLAAETYMSLQLAKSCSKSAAQVGELSSLLSAAP